MVRLFLGVYEIFSQYSKCNVWLLSRFSESVFRISSFSSRYLDLSYGSTWQDINKSVLLFLSYFLHGGRLCVDRVSSDTDQMCSILISFHFKLCFFIVNGIKYFPQVVDLVDAGRVLVIVNAERNLCLGNGISAAWRSGGLKIVINIFYDIRVAELAPAGELRKLTRPGG